MSSEKVTNTKVFTLRVNENLFERIRNIANISKRSISQQIAFILEEYANDFDKNGKIK